MIPKISARASTQPTIPPISGPRDGDRPFAEPPPSAAVIDSVGIIEDTNNADERKGIDDSSVEERESDSEDDLESFESENTDGESE
jgi:hypothetical protein